MNDKKIVLVVGMGTSPAVMTETKKEERKGVRYDV